MINKILRVVTALPGILFLLMGLRWLIDPGGVAAELGMPLLEGRAQSSQVGDLSAFFLTLGSCILLGVVTLKRAWFYPAIMLLGLAALGRTVAWGVHGAALTPDLIGVEVVLAALIAYAAYRLGDEKAEEAR